jgi:hypothetical protein
MSFAGQEFECTIAEAAVLLEIMTDAGDKVFLWGSPGIGKTEIVHQLGERKKRKVIEFHATLREQVDLRGVPVVNTETKTTDWYPPSELPQAERDGEAGYLFCDEYNQAPPQMQSALGGLVLTGKVGEYEMPKAWIVIAAGNRVSDRASAQRMPSHVRNRFAHLIVVPDLPAWCDWANKNAVAPELVAFLRLRQGENGGKGLLHVMPKGDENAYPTPRSWVKAAKYVNAPKQYRAKLIAAHVGTAYATEFDAFIDLYRSIGDLQDIVKNPKAAKLPNDPSTRYATCTGLARMATKGNIANVVEYVKRLKHRESEALVMHDATTRDEALKNTAIYGAWAVANQDLTIQ